jgi:hypothetical protein
MCKFFQILIQARRQEKCRYNIVRCTPVVQVFKSHQMCTFGPVGKIYETAMKFKLKFAVKLML